MAKQQVTIRRAPRLWSFMVTGALAGIVVALVLTAANPVDPKVGFGATFGFFAVFGVGIGLALGGIIGVALDRASRSTGGVAEIIETKPSARKPRTK
jgi:hypothetical protein